MDSVLRAVTVYAFLLAATRLTGRRTLAQTTPFDLVLLLIIAETTQQALLGDDYSVTSAAVMIATLFATDVLLAFLKDRSRRIASWLDGHPTVLMSNGEADLHALRRARVGIDDILEAARMQHGLKTLRDIEAAVLEISGGISIIPRKDR